MARDLGLPVYPDLISGSGDEQDIREQYGDPEGLKRFSGFGATEEDLKRGFVDPDIHDHPKYNRLNYVDRWTVPKESLQQGGSDVEVPSDLEFRNKDRVSHGILTRPRVSTER